VQTVGFYNTVHLEETSCLGAPVAPIEAITVDEAMSKNALNWKAAVADELKAMADMNIFKVLRGNTEAVKIISSRWVVRKKFRADGSIARRKVRHVI